MTDLHKRNEKFCAQWEKRRHKKWRYIFLNGSILGLIPPAFTFLTVNRFNFANADFTKLLLSILVFQVGGLLMTSLQFNATEKHYLKVKNSVISKTEGVEPSSLNKEVN